MNIEIEKKEDYTYVKLSEEHLDSSIAASLTSELVIVNATGEKNIILDLSACESCDSEGLNTLNMAHRLCKTSKGFLVLAGIQEQVEHKITLAQLDKEFNISYRAQLAEKKLKTLLE